MYYFNYIMHGAVIHHLQSSYFWSNYVWLANLEQYSSSELQYCHTWTYLVTFQNKTNFQDKSMFFFFYSLYPTTECILLCEWLGVHNTVKPYCARDVSHCFVFQLSSIIGCFSGEPFGACVRFPHWSGVQGGVPWLFCYVCVSDVFVLSSAHPFSRSLFCL